MNKAWFEMKDLRKKEFNRNVWIPLRAVQTIEESGRYGYAGYKQAFFGAGTVLVPKENQKEASELTWSEVGINHESRVGVEADGKYNQCDVFDYSWQGLQPVLEQSLNSDLPHIWHLHQDIVIALQLLRENDVWIAPNEDYIEVVRLHRRSDKIGRAHV